MTLWLIGGIDPTGGAGVLRDHWTATAVAPALPTTIVATAFTHQGNGRATAIPCPASRLENQVAALPTPSAVKIGLVPDAVTRIIAEVVGRLSTPIVVDPVMQASDGGALGATPEGLELLLDLATLMTPNLPEAVRLCRRDSDPGVLLDLLRQRFPDAAILLKGGHTHDRHEVVDRLALGASVHEFTRARRLGPEVRGTGCALATVAACSLAQGYGTVAAVEAAIAWVDAARARTQPGPDGRPHLPP